jgi:hypothetical protein
MRKRRRCGPNRWSSTRSCPRWTIRRPDDDPLTGKLFPTLSQRTRIHWYALVSDPKCDKREIVNSAPPGRANILVEEHQAGREIENASRQLKRRI